MLYSKYKHSHTAESQSANSVTVRMVGSLSCSKRVSVLEVALSEIPLFAGCKDVVTFEANLASGRLNHNPSMETCDDI